MKTEEDIKFVCETLCATTEAVEALSDQTFDDVVRLIRQPKLELTDKERAFAAQLAERLSND